MIFEFIEENKFLKVTQSRFQPGDSCEYQPLLIAHNIYADFDQNPPPEVQSCFLVISKVFDKVGMKSLFIGWKLCISQVVFLACFKVS